MTIEKTVEAKLCVSCGICAAVCPKEAIQLVYREGGYYPEVSQNDCVDCGKCMQVCPGCNVDYSTNLSTEKNSLMGNYLYCKTAWSKDSDIRDLGTSGGITTMLLSRLLERGDYDGAFVLDTYNYQSQLKAHLHQQLCARKTTKSRYLTASQEETVRYMLKNREKKLIIVATSCCVHGLLNIIEQYSLDRGNYLLIGLFCDNTLNYNVVDFLGQSGKTQDRVEQLAFRTKKSGGWSGNVEIVYQSGKVKYLNRLKRMLAKPYFKNQCCLYCVDKLNMMADISIGDNYTNENSDILGSNTVIVRTELGLAAWESVADSIEQRDISSVEAVKKSQLLKEKEMNYSHWLAYQECLDKKTFEYFNCGLEFLVNAKPMVPTAELEMLRLGQNRDFGEIRKQIGKIYGTGIKAYLKDIKYDLITWRRNVEYRHRRKSAR